ncbi:rab-GTPase-TBC domain-containing protein [Mycena belliarum]|uniref:Rab-GTPase-TBC domain-containing protein n=1 Tax=Mycena belliarum TaxID=1033014 RepID=A0AAD6TXA5_9AGAR|nr:rab-GTPase-TBC domain-containing protein [Mycena belliae]
MTGPGYWRTWIKLLRRCLCLRRMDSEKASPSCWADYRHLSLCPGGFGEKRADIWPHVLHAHPQPVPEASADDKSSHPDERQIRLDTERSFVLYPVDSSTDKDTLQSELNHLLVEIFRKRPKLNYFQGYHDIITVLLLTLPPELQLHCAEQLSLQRVRDSMGSTLEPVLGLLRVMRNLLRVADPTYAELLERTSPLPYYALPNLLTLFSHDMPTLPLIQHVFDYLLCRPPIFVVYLATAIILSRKEDVERLEEEGEEGMMHSLLSALPQIVDGPLDEEEIQLKMETDSVPEETAPCTLDPPEIKQEALDSSPALESRGDDHPSDAVQPSGSLSTGQEDSPAFEIEHFPAESTSLSQTELPSTPLPDAPAEKLESLEEPPNPGKIPKPRPRHLTDILSASEALHDAYPPSHPALQLSSIMGPQSVIFTWSPRLEDMPASDEAEGMVQRLDLIVYPEPPVVEIDKGKNAKKRHRKRFKRRGTGPVGMLVGAGLVLGVAVAISVYGAHHGGDREWRKLGRWVGGVFAGASARVTRYMD